MTQAYIVAAVRTAGGKKGGRMSGWHPADLAAQVLDELVTRTGADPALIEDVIMGCVGQVGEQATNIARGAVLASRLLVMYAGRAVETAAVADLYTDRRMPYTAGLLGSVVSRKRVRWISSTRPPASETEPCT